MADLSKITLPDNTKLNIKDATARSSLATKQDTLISGTNIKTINNESLLGSGNITIQSGGDSLPDQTGHSGDILTTNGTAASWMDVSEASSVSIDTSVTPNSSNLITSGAVATAISNIDALPSQTGNSGKFLTTNGINASWATVSAGDSLPSQTGNSGKFLITNGTTASWSELPKEVFLVYIGSQFLWSEIATAIDNGKVIVAFEYSEQSSRYIYYSLVDSCVTNFVQPTESDFMKFISYDEETQVMKLVVWRGRTNGTPTWTKTNITLVNSVNSQTGDVQLFIPTKTSDLTNDSGFITNSEIPSPADATPLMDGTAAVGTSTDYAREDHVHPTDTSRQATITASGILKGNGSGTISTAVSGTDYIVPPLSPSSGDVLTYNTTNGWVAQAPSGSLPSQTGNSGKYLTTNGTTASWGATSATSTKSIDSSPTSASSNLVTSGGVYTAINTKVNRTTAVNVADTNYTTLMARGVVMLDGTTYDAVSDWSTYLVNGAIAWRYE